MRAVVALGGNALASDPNAPFPEQLRTVRETVAHLAALHREGHDLLVTHGNGPQVGNRLLEQEAADTPDLPLDVLVAETQAQVGALLQRGLDATLDEHFLTVVTQVVVDPDAAAFDDPTKPVGPWYTEAEARERGFETRAVGSGDRPYRRVVPSPEPESVIEAPEIAAMVDRGSGVICGGGGGVPVAVRDGDIEGVEAVVDKDYTAHLLAAETDATELVFVTNEDGIYVDYGTDAERRLTDVDAATLREHHAAGQFPPGSMGPKVEACLRFVEGGGDRAVVARPGALEAAVDGDAGTRVHPSM